MHHCLSQEGPVVRYARFAHGGDQLVCTEPGYDSLFSRADALQRTITTIHRLIPQQPDNPTFRPGLYYIIITEVDINTFQYSCMIIFISNTLHTTVNSIIIVFRI